MGILGAAGLAEKAGLQAPLFEVILPMTENSHEMIGIQEAFQEMSSLRHPLLKITRSQSLEQLSVIPLFEQVDVIMDADKVVREYLDYYRYRFGAKPSYIRPYVARSDPALNSGLVPTVLSIKLALAKFAQLEVPAYPIIGSASLPFRGGLTPETVDQFANEYKGVRTALIQSAFRYDYDLDSVRKAIAQMEELFPQHQPDPISAADEAAIRQAIPVFEAQYRPVIEQIADVINAIAGQLPRRRERVQHVGLFGYSRGVGSVKLPRAIGFTASLYSIGVPPEIIGTGRALELLKKDNPQAFEAILTHYLNHKQDLQRAMRYVNMRNLTKLAKESSAWKAIKQDVAAIEKILKIKAGPQTAQETEHERLTSEILDQHLSGRLSGATIEQAAVLRKSMG
jgi:phosphoenolpyruvate carboxylase